jgi:glycosyltransferase involved in cell wall biosynthesis
MPGITALVHTRNDGLRIGRCLETLYPCDELLIVDHGSEDSTLRVAAEYGAKIAHAIGSENHPLRLSGSKWVLCLDARESLTESLAASLYEWKRETPAEQSAFSMFLREETAGGWIDHPTPEIRLVPAHWKHWRGNFPENNLSACTLEGDLLRFVLP